MKINTAFVALIILTLFLFPSTMEASSSFLIKTHHIELLKNQYPIKVQNSIPEENIYEITLENPDTLRQLQQEPFIEFLDENRTIALPPVLSPLKMMLQSTATLLSTWPYQSMHFPDHTYGSNPITIAVLDTGIDLNHPDLASYLVEGYSSIGTTEPLDDNGHGTHVAGIIAREMPLSVKLMPVKVLDREGYGTLFSVVDGIYYAMEKRVDLINMSFGYSENDPIIQEAIQKAVKSGITIVAAAGNEGRTPILYPARYPEVIAVSAYNEKGERAYFSQYGADVDFAAPGTSISSTYLNGGYKVLNGTSMATPFITRAIGLLKVENPFIGQEDIRKILVDSAIDMGTAGFDPYFGNGKVNVSKAISHSFDKNQDGITDLQDWVHMIKANQFQSHFTRYYGK